LVGEWIGTNSHPGCQRQALRVAQIVVGGWWWAAAHTAWT
jgi:hypothetical protein